MCTKQCCLLPFSFLLIYINKILIISVCECVLIIFQHPPFLPRLSLIQWRSPPHHIFSVCLHLASVSILLQWKASHRKRKTAREWKKEMKCAFLHSIELKSINLLYSLNAPYSDRICIQVDWISNWLHFILQIVSNEIFVIRVYWVLVIFIELMLFYSFIWIYIKSDIMVGVCVCSCDDRFNGIPIIAPKKYFNADPCNS